MKPTVPLFAFLLLFTGLIAPMAADAHLTGKEARHMAIKACKDKQAGDQVLFINRHGKRVAGICTEKEELIAVPLETKRP